MQKACSILREFPDCPLFFLSEFSYLIAMRAKFWDFPHHVYNLQRYCRSISCTVDPIEQSDRISQSLYYLPSLSTPISFQFSRCQRFFTFTFGSRDNFWSVLIWTPVSSNESNLKSIKLSIGTIFKETCVKSRKY